MAKTTFDGAALEILLAPPSAARDARLAALRVSAEIALGERCPSCESTDVEHGCGSARRCCECGDQFDARDA